MPDRDKSTTSSKQVGRTNAEEEPKNGVAIMRDAKENRNGPFIAESKSALTQRKTQQPTLIIDMSKAVQWALLRNPPPSLSQLRSMPPLTKTEDILTRRRMFAAVELHAAARSINERHQIPFEPLLDGLVDKFTALRISPPSPLPYLPPLEFLPQMQPSWALSLGFPHKEQISRQATLFSQNPRTRYDDRVRRSRNTIAPRTRELRPLRLFTDTEIKCGLPLYAGFQLFPWLPAELRLIIWSMNLPGPRFVKVIEENGFFTCAPIINLSVCAESRYEALKIYTFVFANGNQPPMIPFNFEKDVLFISPEIAERRAGEFRSNCNPEDLAKVQRLAVQELVDRPPTSPNYLSSYWPVDDLFGRFSGNSSSKLILSGLKEFTLISGFLEDTKVARVALPAAWLGIDCT